MTTRTRTTGSRSKLPKPKPRARPPARKTERRHELSEQTRDGVDAMGTELAQAWVENATGADDAFREHRDEVTQEELGGPFVITTGDIEFASGTDASNPIDAEREAFPTVSRPPRRSER